MGVTQSRQPAVFFGHGSPMLTLEDNRYTRAWRALGAAMPKPKAILCVSAHWFTRGSAVTAMRAPKTIHDFGGFPRALFDVRYPAPGDPALAARVAELLAPVEVVQDESWGLDHGAWTVLRHAFPDADVPVVQLSIDATQPPDWHYDLGERLAPLRDEGVLVAGSGNVVHNLGLMRRGDGVPAFDWAVRFNDRIRASLAAKERAGLTGYAAQGDDARLSVPTPEHYLPIVYVAALAREDETLSFAIDGIENGSLGMLSVVTTPRA